MKAQPPLPKPGFFIVGAPKCGTTAMANYLNQHPQIFMPIVKEPDFFGSDLRGVRYTNDLNTYLKLFAAGHDKLCGEGSTAYLISTCAAREIYEFNPEAKIIILIRNPVDMLYSLHNQMVFSGGENIEDFRLALAAEPDRKQGNRIPHICAQPEALFYTENAYLSVQIQRYLEVFGWEQVHIIVFDDLKDDTARVYRRTLEFLGVDPTFQADFKVVNSSKYIRSKALRFFFSNPLLRDIRKPLLANIPLYLRRSISFKIKEMNTRYQARPPMDALLQRQLQQEFADEVRQLSALIGRDLSHWANPDTPNQVLSQAEREQEERIV